MRVERLRVRDFRSYEGAEAHLGEGLTVVHGANGAGKTNLLEALYFGCTARSFRTANERELVRFGASATRVVVEASDDDGRHELAVGFSPGEPKRLSLDGAPLEHLLDAPQRPLVSVFSPDRLELVKGVPQLRRAHVDQLVTALWPTRAATRRGYGEALAQRNALLTRIRGGRVDAAALRPWDVELARLGIEPSASVGSADSPTAPARARARRSNSPRRSQRRYRSTLRAATRRTVRTATTWSYAATGATCGPMARRASSVLSSSRCCLPSATRWRPSARDHR